MTRLTLLLTATVLTFSSYGQKKIRTTTPDLTKFSNDITYEGTLIHSVSWKDKAGTHVFIASETEMKETTDSAGNIGRTGYIAGQHYLLGDTIKRTWTEGDSVIRCNLMTRLTFLPLFTLTDIDKDGYNELWIIYKSACYKEISPAKMQLVMHEENQRFTMIGTSKVETADKQYFGGEYQFNNQFLEGNPAFKKRGMDLWNDYMKEY